MRSLIKCDEVPLSIAMRDDFLLSGEGGRGLARARLWKVEGGSVGAPLSIFAEHGGPIFSVALGDGVAISGSNDRTARVWALTGRARSLGTLSHPVWVGSVSVVGALAATGSADCKVRLWSLAPGYPCVRTFAHCSSSDAVNLVCVRLTLGGGALLSGGPDGNLTLWSLEEETVGELRVASVKTLAHGASVRGLAAAASSGSSGGCIVSAGGAGKGRRNIRLWSC